MEKTILSFYCDDTNPYVASPAAFKTFLDFVSSEGVAGEASFIPGYSFTEHGLTSRPTTALQASYIQEMQRAYVCGVDTHFELMTHAGLFNFNELRIPEGAIHEGLWLHEPAIPVSDYEAYFTDILAEAERVGVQFTGMTWPGCGCKVCSDRYRQLWFSGFWRRIAESQREGLSAHRLRIALKFGPSPNPAVWQALLNLGKKGRFRGRTVPCFFDDQLRICEARLMASEGEYHVVDLPPNATDRLGSWINSPAEANTDYYITSDGQAGRLVELVRAGAPYALFYAHWQGLNPENGCGWPAFTELVKRVERFLHGQVVWMRPSEMAAYLLESPEHEM